MTESETSVSAAVEKYRLQVRETFQRFSDEALAFQSARIVGGVDRQECDRELERRRAGGARKVGS